MKAFITATGLVAGASAAVVARDQCCFQLTASGGASGTVGQLSDGQVSSSITNVACLPL